MNDLDEVTIAILAGGRSSRMGYDKSFAMFSGKPLIEHVFERTSGAGIRRILITNNPQRYAAYGVPQFSDVVPDKGSLGGIFTALCYSTTPYTLCVGCDMPLLNPALLCYLSNLRHGYDAVVPHVNGRPQSLHTLYSENCRHEIFRRMLAGNLKIADLFGSVNARPVFDEDLRAFDPGLRSFVNANTPDDLRRLELAVSSQENQL